MTWNEYLIHLAHAVAMKSKDTTKVGCVIVGQDHEILATGFNGAPIGVTDRLERPIKYKFTSHAEQNAVSFAARNGHALRGSTAYVTHHPCSACARSLIQAGIRCVVVGDGVTHMDAVEFEVAAVMFEEAGVEIIQENSNSRSML